ncbi:hypothetical protein AMATHDRAFT_8142 [Amanita thiersii Skay4041]|uniref:RRM domain-containing protein n=1 Tax=Amanita thiersii Skay4041 TaxID=703135 RepID=A0A2A9NEV3_9AGAR|nr:hypothetical protein AMATHDRAFT_8142 [Amanita thiersii Skay4041]
MASPTPTLYINNLNDKVNKDELCYQLYALFTTYGRVIDIVASKRQNMRGQAFLVFADLTAATSAMRACEGMVFYDKPMRITYAKSKSYATLRREDPNFVPPTAANPSSLVSQSTKRQRDEQDKIGGDKPSKREKNDEEDEEEMEIDEDEDGGKFSQTPSTSIPPPVQQPSARLLCTNLPHEVTDDVLSVLFQQYQGFQTTQVTWSPNPNPAGTRTKMAQIFFETPELATVAKEALDGFTLKKGWQMSVVYI